MMNAALRNSGVAPPMARSFTVPWTASEPISPPGKNSGFTTNESVVKARRTPFTFTMPGRPYAPARDSGMPAGRRRASVGTQLASAAVPEQNGLRARRVAQGNDPKFVRQWFSSSLILTCGRVAAIVIISRARAFGRNHRRAQWIFRSAAHTKRGTIGRLLQSLQDLGADAFGRFFPLNRPSQRLVGVEGGELLSQRKPLCGIGPMPRHFRSATSNTSTMICCAGSFPCSSPNARIGFPAWPAGLQLRTSMRTACNISTGSNPPTTIGTRKSRTRSHTLCIPHRTDVAWRDETLHAVLETIRRESPAARAHATPAW